jgi:hypothetical protein
LSSNPSNAKQKQKQKQNNSLRLEYHLERKTKQKTELKRNSICDNISFHGQITNAMSERNHLLPSFPRLFDTSIVERKMRIGIV